MILDVGCGNRPRGNVNVDLTKEWNPMRYKKKSMGIPYEHIPNFIIADAHHLPFIPHIFDVVINFSGLEHVKEPVKAISEMLRVSKGSIEIYVPHWFWRTKNHRHRFNRKWFRELFKLLNLFDWTLRIRTKKIPHQFIPLISLPYGIDVTVRCIHET